MTNAFTFPGQGSQHVGMGKELAETYKSARTAFDEVNDALDFDLSNLMFEGPADELTLTENTQPALLVVSVAVMRILAENGVVLPGAAQFVAGHSLGEYSALAAAGAISLADAAKLVRTRGRAMQEAVPVGAGAMAAILGLDFDDVVRVAEEAAGDDVCQAANDNAPGQVVVSGTAEAVGRAITIAQDKGAKRAILLPVSAPFHCSLMAPAADIMAEELALTEIRPPQVPVVANVLAEPITDPADIRKHLVAQVTGTVRWRESVVWMADNSIETLYELGSGKVLTGLARRIDKRLSGVPVGTPDEISAVIEALT